MSNALTKSFLTERDNLKKNAEDKADKVTMTQCHPDANIKRK